jgi:hypothetical protein
MLRILGIALLPIFVWFPAHAQTTAELQALGQQYAQQYGVPWNVYQQTIQAESGWNPNIGCNGHGACGIAQFIPGTAAQFGIDPNNAQQSLQAAAQYLAQLYQQNGSWVGALTAYSGGCTPAVPCNPAYAQDFANAQADDNGPVDFAGGAGGGQAPVAPAVASASASPFAFIFNEIMNNVLPKVGNMIAAAIQAIWTPFLAILTLAIAIRGFQTMNGSFDMAEFLFFTFRAVLVTAFLAPNQPYFAQWVEEPLLGLPSWFASIFTVQNAAVDIASPASFFDQCYNGLWATATSVWHSTGWSFHVIEIAIGIVVTLYLGIGALFFMFIGFLLGNFLVFILIIVAPFIIPSLLFRATHAYFIGYIHTVVTALLTALIVNIVLGLYFGLITDIVPALTLSGNASTDLPGFAGLVVALLIMGFTTVYIPSLARAIGHGVGVSMESASRHMSGQMIAQHGAAAGRFLGGLG